MTIEHRDLGNVSTKMHGVVWQTVANAAALAALVIVAADVDQAKPVKQTDTGSLWIPTSIGAGATYDSLVKVAGAALADGQVPVWVAASGNWQAQTLTPIITPPANPGDNGAVPIANAGDFTYVKGTLANQVLTWNGAAWAAAAPGTTPNVSNAAAGLAPIITGTTGLALISNGVTSAWSTNFQAQNLQTTGGIGIGGGVTPTSTLAAGVLSFSGRGNGAVTYRNTGNTADVTAIIFGNGATDDRMIIGNTGGSTASVTVNLSTGRMSLGSTQVVSWSATNFTLVPTGVSFNFTTSGTIQRGSATVFGLPNNSGQLVELWANAVNFQGGDRVVGWNQVATIPTAAPASTVVFLYVNKEAGNAALSHYGASTAITTLGF